MKKTIIFTAVLMSFVTVVAQNTYSHSIEASFGGGLHTLFLGAEKGDASQGFGFCLNGMYLYQVNDQIAFGTGLSLGSMHSSVKFNFSTVENNVLLPGALYSGRVTTTFKDWIEKQNIIYLGVPIEVFYYLQTSSALFRFGAGLQLNLPLWSEYKTVGGQYTRTLFLSETGVTYSDMPNHYLGTFVDNENGKFESNVGLGLIYDAGVFFLDETDYRLYAGLYGMVGFNTMADAGVRDLFDDRYNYQGMPNSIHVSHTLPFEIGVKISLCLGVPRPAK